MSVHRLSSLSSGNRGEWPRHIECVEGHEQRIHKLCFPGHTLTITITLAPTWKKLKLLFRVLPHQERYSLKYDKDITLRVKQQVKLILRKICITLLLPLIVY